VGHVQGVLFTPINKHSHTPFQLINIYLPCGDNPAVIKMLEHMKNLNNSLHTFMGGDFNFVTSLEDTTSPTLPPVALLDAWRQVVRHLGLSEATQPLHTHHNITNDPASPHNHSARIDRWFHSYSEGELAILVPTCCVRSRPRIGTNNPLDSRPKDHLPMSLTYISTTPPKKRAFPNTPAHIPLNPLFRSTFVSIWYDSHHDKHSHPIQRWRAQNELISKVAREVSKREKPDRNALARYSGLIKVIRLLSESPAPNIDQAKIIFARFSLPPLSFNSDSSPNNHPYIDNLNKLIIEHGVAETEDPIIPPPPDSKEPNLLDPSYKPDRHNFIKKMKVCLPSTRKRIRALRASLDDPLTDSPTAMGTLIKNFWGGLWEEMKMKPGSKREKLFQKLLKKFP